MATIRPPWRWVVWTWREWHGKGQNYSHLHLIDPARSSREKLVTACGETVGRVIRSITITDPPPEDACKLCRAVWRKD